MNTTLEINSINVHVLSEYVFCPRAALNSYLDDFDDSDDDAILRLNYQPVYDLVELERLLNQAATTLWQLALAALAFYVTGILLGRLVHWVWFWAGLVAACYMASTLVRQLPEVLRLLRIHRTMRIAIPALPSDTVWEDEPVNWWSLRAAGFVATPCPETLHDDERLLTGKPWRILRLGDELAIPAYVRASEGEIRPQHRARIAGYCKLLRDNGYAASPYGIVLEPGTFEGTAVKPTDDNIQAVTQVAIEVMDVILNFQRHGVRPEAPSNPQICRTCPHGKPRQFKAGTSDTTSLDVTIKANRKRCPRNGRYYHSSCGDRFGWVAEHEEAKSLGLS